MSATYKYNRSLHAHHLMRAFLVITLTIIALGIIALVWHHYTRPLTVIDGPTTYVPQTTKAQQFQVVNEPLFTFQLPADWRQTASSVDLYSWQATLKNNDNRYLSIYVDNVPTSLPVNRELPVIVNGNQLTYGALSNNCANFTIGGTLDVSQAEKLKPAASIWQGVNFICNLPQVVDNQIGTGVAGGAVNTIPITGSNNGTHNYFFLYTDRNAQPDYTIIYKALQTFKAK